MFLATQGQRLSSVFTTNVSIIFLKQTIFNSSLLEEFTMANCASRFSDEDLAGGPLSGSDC